MRNKHNAGSTIPRKIFHVEGKPSLQRLSYVWMALLLASLSCAPVDVARHLAVMAFGATPTPTPEPTPSPILYVAPDGDDANDCLSPETPCLRINTAIARAATGWIVQLAPGLYDEAHEYVYASVHIDKAISLRGSGPDSTFIIGHDLNYRVVDVQADGMVVIEDVTLEEGRPPTGYGLYANSPVSLSNVIIRRNFCGIEALEGLIMQNVQVLSNRDCGVKVYRGTVTIEGSIIAENGGYGLALGVETTSNVRNTTLRDNRPGDNAGFENDGTSYIDSSTISSNAGDGIFNSGDMHIENTTVSGNTGNGVFNRGSLSVMQTSIAFNHGIGLSTSNVYETLEIANSLFVDNTAGDCWYALTWSFAPEFSGVNISSDGSCDYGRTGDPAPITIGPLADNGGPTLTHALEIGNPAIDAARETCLETDQRGVTRPQGVSCDVGAYELSILTDGGMEALSGDAPEGVPTGPVTCRFGPGTIYGAVLYYDLGEKLRILARDYNGTWLEVQQGDSSRCWVFRDLVDVDPEFDVFALPVGVIPPTPTWTPLAPTPKPPQGCMHQGPNDNQPKCYAPCPVPNPTPGGACTP